MSAKTTGAPWDEMTSRWRDLYDEQAKIAQKWVETQAELASTLSATLSGTDGDSADAAKIDPAAMAELWRSGMSMGNIAQGLTGLQSTGIGSETLGKMLDPMSLSLMGGNQVGEAIRRLTEGPRLADAGSIERGMAQIMELYLGVQTAARAYESVVASAWVEANRRFAAEVSRRFTDTGEVLQAKDALRAWLDVANETLMETHRSEPFLHAQRQLLRAGMDFLLAERTFIEQLVEPAGLPTRTEIDELHQTVHALKRRVRELEASHQEGAGEAKPATPARPRPKSRTTPTRGASK